MSCNAVFWHESKSRLSKGAYPLIKYYYKVMNTFIGWDKTKLYNGFPKPGSRHISNKLISTTKITKDSSISHMVMQWGQFLDHDIDHSMEAISRETFENGITCSSTCDYSTPCFPIEIPDDDNR